MAKQIAEAREKGDLSENAEYDAAKDAQGLLEMRIAKLEQLVATARIIDDIKRDASKVSIQSQVKIKQIRTQNEVTYRIVTEEEANSKEGKISATSPIGKALIGKKVGDKVTINAPAGAFTVQVINISF